MNERQALGAQGEALAAAHLQAQGCVVRATRWRPAGQGLQGDIDLVVQDGPTLVFVEVRTRRGAAGRAEESVTPTKQRRLLALALAYLQAHDLPDATDWRVDVVAIQMRAAGPPVLTWLRGAVEG